MANAFVTPKYASRNSTVDHHAVALDSNESVRLSDCGRPVRTCCPPLITSADEVIGKGKADTGECGSSTAHSPSVASEG